MRYRFFHQAGMVEGWRGPASPPPAPLHTRHRARGQALVEMALAMGVLLLFLLGGLDCLQLLMTNYTVSQAVRAAAHQAALIGGPDGQNGSWGALPHPSGTVAETARVILDKIGRAHV